MTKVSGGWDGSSKCQSIPRDGVRDINLCLNDLSDNERILLGLFDITTIFRRIDMNRIVRNVIGFLLVLVLYCHNRLQRDYSNVENPIVTMEFEEFGVVEIELYPQVAPNTVQNSLNRNGFMTVDNSQNCTWFCNPGRRSKW